jgi:hypothetical protein
LPVASDQIYDANPPGFGVTKALCGMSVIDNNAKQQ